MKEIKLFEGIDKLFDLQDKICLVAGAGGIGAVIAEAFGEKKAVVAVADLNINDAKAVQDKIINNGGRAKAFQVDVTVKANVQKLVDDIVENFKRIDVLVNAFGISGVQKAVDFDEKMLAKIFAVNIYGTVYFCQCAGQVMTRQGYGKIINLGSIGGEINHTYGTMPYSASKAAVHQITRSFAGELAEYGINVNALAPAWVRTPMMENRDKRIYDGIGKGVPFGRMLEPFELIGATIFLATSASDFVTGVTLPIDGGFLACKQTY